MKTYKVSGTIENVSGFGWRNFLLNGAKYEARLTLQGKKSIFDTMMGNLKYELTLISVKSLGAINIASFVADSFGGKRAVSGLIGVKGPTMVGLSTGGGYDIAYNVEVKDAWKSIGGKIDVASKATASTDVSAVLTNDDGAYDNEV